MKRAQIASREDDRSRLGEDRAPAGSSGGGGIDARHNPRQAGQLNVLVILPQQSRASEWRSQPLGPVNNASYDRGVVMIGGGHRIGAQHGHAQQSAFHTNREDVDRVVVLHRLRDLAQIGGQPLAVKFSFQHFGKARLASGTAGSTAGPAGGVMNGKRSFLKIALELKSGFPDESLILGVVADGGQFSARVRPAG